MRAIEYMSGCAVVICLLVGMQSLAIAADPHISVIKPRGAQRGTTNTVEFHGQRIGDPVAILFYTPNITAHDFEVSNPKSFKCAITTTDSCPPGLYAMRLVTQTGISNLKLLAIGTLPQRNETEPNNNSRQSQRVELPVTINGIITNEDIDYFEFEAHKGQRLSLEIEAMRLGDILFDPHIALLDARGAVVASADDSWLVHQDAILCYQVPADGAYRVAVREASYRGDGRAQYRLHMGSFPRPHGVFPPGGQPGEQLVVKWIGDPKLTTSTITLPHRSGSVFAEDDSGAAPSGIPVRINNMPQYLEQFDEPEQPSASCTELPCAFAGILEVPGDEDVYHFPTKKNEKISARVFGRRLRSPIDPVIHFARPGKPPSLSNDDAGGFADSSVDFTAQSEGELTLRIHDLLRGGGPDYVYRIEVTATKPILKLYTPRHAQHVAVPKGNRNAIVVQAYRKHFGGPLDLFTEALPSGLTAQLQRMQGNVSAVPVVFEAEQSAPLESVLISVTATHPEHSHITGSIYQNIRLTDFKDKDMATHLVQRLPVATIQPLPYALEIVQPEIPLVRRGHMDLELRLSREEGFNQPVSIQLLWNPPGVGSGTLQLKPNQTTAKLRVNAGRQAALGSWPLVAIARANIQGTTQVSSQLATLDIVDPAVTVTLEQSRVTVGEQATIRLQTQHHRAITTACTISLRGLPRGVSAEPQILAAGQKSIELPISAATDAAVGRHGNVFAQIEIADPKGTILYRGDNALLIVDAPLTPKKNKQTAQAQPAPKPKRPKKTANKRERAPRREGMVPAGSKP